MNCCFFPAQILANDIRSVYQQDLFCTPEPSTLPLATALPADAMPPQTANHDAAKRRKTAKDERRARWGVATPAVESVAAVATHRPVWCARERPLPQPLETYPTWELRVDALLFRYIIVDDWRTVIVVAAASGQSQVVSQTGALRP